MMVTQFSHLQVRAATWSLEHNVSVVIANGFQENCVLDIVNGKKLGTFFTNAPHNSTPVEVQAAAGEYGKRRRSSQIDRLFHGILAQP